MSCIHQAKDRVQRRHVTDIMINLFPQKAGDFLSVSANSSISERTLLQIIIVQFLVRDHFRKPFMPYHNGTLLSHTKNIIVPTFSGTVLLYVSEICFRGQTHVSFAFKNISWNVDQPIATQLKHSKLHDNRRTKEQNLNH